VARVECLARELRRLAPHVAQLRRVHFAEARIQRSRRERVERAQGVLVVLGERLDAPVAGDRVHHVAGERAVLPRDTQQVADLVQRDGAHLARRQEAQRIGDEHRGVARRERDLDTIRCSPCPLHVAAVGLAMDDAEHLSLGHLLDLRAQVNRELSLARARRARKALRSADRALPQRERLVDGGDVVFGAARAPLAR